MADPAETLIEAMLAALPLPALVIDRDEWIIAANDAARALLGPRLTGRHFATILRQPPVVEAIEAGLREGRPGKARHLASHGARKATYEVSCRPIADLAAKGALMVAFQDVSPMQQAGRMRRDFVANVSHELRTPLTALIGFIETLRGPARNDAEALTRFLETMAVEAARMDRLIDDLLSLSRVEQQERIRPRAAVDLGDCLGATLKTLAPLAERDGVTLSLSAPETPVIVAGDADQLRQVFTNLIENAVKYGGSGGRVEVSLSALSRDPALRGPGARIDVRDHGPGIDPVHLPRLTERFYRGDAHRSRALGGTGLGLAIVKHIVNRHRGRLKIDSEPGQGATFGVLLPRDAR